jgi:uncharacterized protein (UPF0548 family)
LRLRPASALRLLRHNKGVFFVQKPGDRRIREYLAAQKVQPLSYQEAGATREGAPPGYNIDHNRIQLGRGEDVFERAKAAIREWKMFAMPWVELCWRSAPIEIGSTVGVLVSHFGFWSLNAARIVYLIDDSGDTQRFGFAYGTLDGHAEMGEERFTVEFHPAGTVWYDLYAFSRPRGLARCAYPISRVLQRRFARDSMAAMRRATL